MKKIPSRFTDEDKKKIIKQYEDGLSRGKLAKVIGTKSEVITSILLEGGVVLRPIQIKKLSEVQERELADRYANREPGSELCKEYDITPHTMIKIVKRLGVEVNPRGQQYRAFSKDEISLMEFLWKSGISQHKIAEHLNVHQSTISKLFIQEGIEHEKRRPRGEDNKSWKGGKHIREGYVLRWMNPDHKFSSMRTRGGYVMEHRLVMAESLGRPLTSKETVHHINGNTQDNRIENLQLRNGRHGKGVKLCCGDCGSINIQPMELD